MKKGIINGVLSDRKRYSTPTILSSGKVIASVFYDSHGVIFLEKGNTTLLDSIMYSYWIVCKKNSRKKDNVLHFYVRIYYKDYLRIIVIYHSSVLSELSYLWLQHPLQRRRVPSFDGSPLSSSLRCF